MKDGQELPANDATGDAANLSPVKGRWADVEPYEVVAQSGPRTVAKVVKKIAMTMALIMRFRNQLINVAPHIVVG